MIKAKKSALKAQIVFDSQRLKSKESSCKCFIAAWEFWTASGTKYCLSVI